MLCVCQSVQGSVEAPLSLELRPAGTRDEVVSLYWVILQSVQCAKVLPLDPRTVPWSWRESTKVAVSPLDPILSPRLQLCRPVDCVCVMSPQDAVPDSASPPQSLDPSNIVLKGNQLF